MNHLATITALSKYCGLNLGMRGIVDSMAVSHSNREVRE